MKKIIILLCLLFLLIMPSSGWVPNTYHVYMNDGFTLQVSKANYDAYCTEMSSTGYTTLAFRWRRMPANGSFSTICNAAGDCEINPMTNPARGSRNSSMMHYDNESLLFYFYGITPYCNAGSDFPTILEFYNVSAGSALPYANLTINVQAPSSFYGMYTKINNSYITYQNSTGYTNITGNLTFNNIPTGTGIIRAYAAGYNDYNESYTLSANSFKQITLTPTTNLPVFNLVTVNVKDGASGSDITDSVIMNQRYNGTWYNESPIYYPMNSTKSPMHYEYKSVDWFAGGVPTLSTTYNGGTDYNGTIIVEKMGYIPYQILGLHAPGRYAITLIPNYTIPTSGKCSKIFDTSLFSDGSVNIVIKRPEAGFLEVISSINHLAQSLNNNAGNYTFSAYISSTGQLLNNGSFKCESGTNISGKTQFGVHREYIYDPSYYTPDAPSLSSRNVYVELSDGITGGNIYPYNINIVDDVGAWYNFTVPFNLGKLTPHAYISDDRIITIYANAQGYKQSSKLVVLSGSTTDASGDHIIKMTIIKDNSNILSTWWVIDTYDSTTFNPVSLAKITIYHGIDVMATGYTGNNGHFAVNITNNTGANYDIVAVKSGYKNGQINNVIPFGNTYSSQIPMIPIVTSTPIPSYTIVPTPTLFNGGLSASTCRQTLDFNSETFWSPILNIEACAGIITPIYQEYILAALFDIIFAIILSRKYNSKEGFVVGVVIANTITAATGLISWSIWVIIVIPMAIIFLYKGGK